MIFKMFAIFCNIKSITFLKKKGKAGGFTDISVQKFSNSLPCPTAMRAI